MSLLPNLLNVILHDYNRPFMQDLHDQYFGLGLLNDDVLQSALGTMLSVPLRSGYMRPWRILAAGDSGVSSFSADKDEFKINLDVQQFKPSELKVTLADGYLVIDGKHEEREDQHGYISRQFRRRYKVPDDVDESKILSSLSSDGVLSISAPKITKKEPEDREIPIVQTNMPVVKQFVGTQQEKKTKTEENKDSEN